MNFLAAAVALTFGVIAAKGPDTYSQLFPDTEPYAWNYENDYLSYLAVRGNVFEYEISILVIDDIFTRLTQSYNCSFAIYDNKYPLIHISVLRRLDERKVLLVPLIKLPGWRMMIVDLRTCEVIEPKVSISAEELFASDDSYDIVTVDSTLCGNKYCKATIDARLNVIDGPKPWFERFGNYLHLVKLKSKVYSDERSLVYQMLFDENYDRITRRLSLLTEQGLKTLVERDDPHLSVSSANEAIGVIFGNDEGTSFEVHQFSFDGKEKLCVTLKFGTMRKQAQIKNLPDGGFLLALGTRNDSSFAIDVTRYNDLGQPITRTEVDGFQEPSESDIVFGPSFYFHENADGANNCLIQIRKGPLESCASSRCTEIFESCFRDDDMEPLMNAAKDLRVTFLFYHIILVFVYYF